MATELYARIVHCPECARDVVGVAHGSYDNPNAHYLGPYEESYHRYALVSCPECKHPFLTAETGHPEGSCFAGPWVLYPMRGDVLSMAVPEAIRRCFNEAQQCYFNHLHTAASVMCRRALDMTCEEQGLTNGGLKGRIDQLREKNIINEALHEWAHALREFGNEGAHVYDPNISAADAQDALSLTKALVEYVYAMRKQYELFKARRSKGV